MTVPLRGERAAGAVLARTGPAAGLVVVAVSLVAAVAVPIGLWRPWLVWPVVVVAVAGSLRRVRRLPAVPVPRWTAITSGALAAGFTLWAAATRAEQVVLRRDPGAYALYAQWIATQHGLPVADHLASFGGAAAYGVPGFSLESPAYYQVLHGGGAALQADVVPQFLVGAPALFSLGWWTGGAVGQPWTGLQLVSPLLGGLALMAFAGLAARLVGARWAPLAVAALGLSFPVLHAARATYSESAALLVLLAGACLLVDALVVDTLIVGALVDGRPGSGRRSAAELGLAAGLVLGLAGLVRVDAVREVALLMPCCALLAVRRHPVAVPVAAGAVTGTAVSVAVWQVMARPYLTTVSASLRPLLEATALVAVASLVAVPLARRWRAVRASRAAQGRAGPGRAAPGRGLARLPAAVTAAVLLLGVALASRPLWLVTRQDPSDPGAAFVAGLQASQGLAVDGARTYAEDTMNWVSWSAGWPALAAAWVLAALLCGRAVQWWLRADDGAAVPPWLVPLVVGLGSTVLVLYRPGITPDHPWADRRLVPVVLPFVVLAATGVAAWAVRRAQRSAPAWRLLGTTVAATVLLLAPGAVTTFPLANQRTEVGEPAAAEAVCASLVPGDAVVAVDSTADGTPRRTINEWLQVVRGVCDVPSAALRTPVAVLPAAVTQLARLVEGSGGRLVLLTAQDDDAAARQVLGRAVGPAGAAGPTGGVPRQVASMVGVEDRKLLARIPRGDARLVIDVWTVAVSARPAGG